LASALVRAWDHIPTVKRTLSADEEVVENFIGDDAAALAAR
jgi:hypothetical protein